MNMDVNGYANDARVCVCVFESVFVFQSVGEKWNQRYNGLPGAICLGES